MSQSKQKTAPQSNMQTAPIFGKTAKSMFPEGIHYFRADDVWFIDTTQTPHIVYIRETQVKVMPGKFYLYTDPNEVSNG